MQLITSLSFNGRCEEAFMFYASALQADNNGFMRYHEMPADPNIPLDSQYTQRIMHTSLSKNGIMILMWADILPMMHSGKDFIVWDAVEVCIIPESKTEADRVFAALSEGWQITMPMEDQFWGDYFGSCKDKFGISWMINCSSKN